MSQAVPAGALVKIAASAALETIGAAGPSCEELQHGPCQVLPISACMLLLMHVLASLALPLKSGTQALSLNF